MPQTTRSLLCYCVGKSDRYSPLQADSNKRYIIKKSELQVETAKTTLKEKEGEAKNGLIIGF